MKGVKIIVEKYGDGYIAYPVGLKEIVVGEGESFRRSAFRNICKRDD